MEKWEKGDRVIVSLGRKQGEVGVVQVVEVLGKVCVFVTLPTCS